MVQLFPGEQAKQKTNSMGRGDTPGQSNFADAWQLPGCHSRVPKLGASRTLQIQKRLAKAFSRGKATPCGSFHEVSRIPPPGCLVMGAVGRPNGIRPPVLARLLVGCGCGCTGWSKTRAAWALADLPLHMTTRIARGSAIAVALRSHFRPPRDSAGSAGRLALPSRSQSRDAFPLIAFSLSTRSLNVPRFLRPPPGGR